MIVKWWLAVWSSRYALQLLGSQLKLSRPSGSKSIHRMAIQLNEGCTLQSQQAQHSLTFLDVLPPPLHRVLWQRYRSLRQRGMLGHFLGRIIYENDYVSSRDVPEWDCDVLGYVRISSTSFPLSLSQIRSVTERSNVDICVFTSQLTHR